MSPAPHPFDDPTVERLIRRAQVDGSVDVPAELEPVARFLSAVADLGDVPVQPRGALVALLADGFEPSAPPAADPLALPAALPLRTRLARLRGPVARLAGLSLVAQLLTGTGVAVASVTAAAGAGVLPAKLQQPVGEVLNVVTPFTFPTAPTGTVQEPVGTSGSTESEPAPAPATSTESSTATTSTVEPTPAPAATTPAAEPTKAEVTPTEEPSATTTPDVAPTPTSDPTPTGTPTDEATGTPTDEQTGTTEPTTEPTTSPSSRPTRQNEKPDKGSPEPSSEASSEPTVAPTEVAPVLVTADPATAPVG